MCKMKRFVVLLLSFCFLMSTLVGCNSPSSQSSETADETVNGDTSFTLSKEEAPYNGSVILDTTVSEKQYHQVFGGTITDSSLWVVVCEEDRNSDIFKSSLFIEEFSRTGERLNTYPLDFSEIGYVCDICKQGNSLIIASCSYNVFNVVSFNLATHKSTPIQLQSGSDVGMSYCQVIALNDQEVFVSMQNSLGEYSCRGYNLSDGSIKMELATTCPTEHFFWEGEQLYTLGQETGRNEYELLKVNEENKLEQSGKIQLPPYVGRMYNTGNKQYMLADRGIWNLEQTTHTWKEMVNWNHADASQFDKTEYAVSQDGQSFLVWDKDNKNVGFLFPDDDPAEGKNVLTVVGDFSFSSEKYQWIEAEFNKQSKICVVEFVDYSDILSTDDYLDEDGYVDDEMYGDALTDYLWKQMANGEGPDIFIRGEYAEGFFGQLNSRFYENGELFVDLNPCFEGMDDEWKQQYIATLINSMKNNGRLYSIPLNFDIKSCLMAKDCKMTPSANFTDWLEYMRTNADGRVIRWETGTDFLRETLSYDTGSFLDTSTGETMFDSPQFRALLELANKYCLSQEEYDNVSSRESILHNCGYWGEDIHELISGVDQDYPIHYGCLSSKGAMSCFRPQEIVSVSTNCTNQEGAWEFICFLLSPEVQEYNLNHAEYSLGDFPVRWDSMDRLFEFLKHPEENEAFWAQENETVDDWSIEDVVPLTDEESEAFVELVKSTHLVYYPDTEIIDIVMEETAPYFAGQKSEDEVIEIINNRLQLLLNERST